MKRAELKENAKQSLKGNWGNAILIMIVFGLLSTAATAVSFIGNTSVLTDADKFSKFLETPSSFNFGWAQVVSGILSILVASFLTLGFVNYHLKVSRNEKASAKDLFSKVNLWYLYFAVSIVTSIFISLGALLLIIPGIIAYYRYAMVNYIMIDNPELGVFGAIKRSKEMMDGHKFDLFVLHLSFIGWQILVGLTFGLLNLYVGPYRKVTEANFYNSIKDGNSK